MQIRYICVSFLMCPPVVEVCNPRLIVLYLTLLVVQILEGGLPIWRWEMIYWI